MDPGIRPARTAQVDQLQAGFVDGVFQAAGDGADALCAIRNCGGTTIAQLPASAGAPDMPDSAIASGCVDFILTPEQIADQIMKIIRTTQAD